MENTEVKKIAVLIPCYNEEQTIEKVINDVMKVLPKADIYVYDNNSKDKTDEKARNAGAIVRYEYQQGKGNVIRSMFREIDADCYIMLDGDDTYPVEYAPQMIELVLNKNVDMVIGDRLSTTYFKENKRAFHNIGNTMVKTFVNKLFKGNLNDIMTGYRAFSPLFVKSFPVLSKGFEIETEMSIFALDNNMHIDTVPVTYRDRPLGSVSKLNTYSDGMKVIFTIIKMFKDYKPFIFFGIFAFIFATSGICLIIPVLTEYFASGLVPKLPTLFVAVMCFVLSVLALSSGFILDTVAKSNRKDFEVKLNIIKMILNGTRRV